MKSTLIIPGIYFSMTSCSFGTDERKFNFLEDNHCQFTPLDVVAYSEYVTPTGQTQNFQLVAHHHTCSFPTFLEMLFFYYHTLPLSAIDELLL